MSHDVGAPAGMPGSVVVVGGGVAGFGTVRELRRRGFAGGITLVEPQGLPYDRPPLSKEFLTGDADEHRLLLAPAGWFPEHGVELVEEAAVRVVPGGDHPGGAPVRHRVDLASGRTLEADTVVLATGGRPRDLDVPGAEHPGVIVLRTRADAQALRDRLAFGTAVAVVGGGFTGAEVAASARRSLAAVTLVTPTAAPALPAVGPALADRLHRMHTEHGVAVEVGRVARIQHRDGDGGAALPAAHRLHLDDGRTVDADVVVLAGGTVPETALAEDAGLDVADGVLTDATGRTAVPGILAVGDAARNRESVWAPSRHWEPALRSGAAAAAEILGEEPDAPGAPWFWSDRYDAHVEAVGDMTVLAGGTIVDREVRGVVVASFVLAADGTMRGAASIDDPMTVKAARRIIDRGIVVDAAALADPAVPVRSLARG